MKFSQAKIVGHCVPISQYREEKKKRGDDGYTMSRGELMDFMFNPHKWRCGIGDDSTRSTEWGNLMDTLVLTPFAFERDYVVAPATYPSKGMQCPQCKSITTAKTCRECKTDRKEIITQKDWDFNATYCIEWREKQVGKQIIKAEMLERANQALEVLKMHDNVIELLDCSRKQVMVTGFYYDADTGISVPLKILLDVVPNKKHVQYGKSLCDFKTALSLYPRNFEKAAYENNYDAQAALYQDLYMAASGEDRPDWRFVAQENQPPYEVANPMPLMSSDFLEIGRSKIAFALKFYCHCLYHNEFPSYSIGMRDQIGDAYIMQPSPWMVEAAVERPKLSPIVKTQKQNAEQSADVIP